MNAERNRYRYNKKTAKDNNAEGGDKSSGKYSGTREKKRRKKRKEKKRKEKKKKNYTSALSTMTPGMSSSEPLHEHKRQGKRKSGPRQKGGETEAQ